MGLVMEKVYCVYRVSDVRGKYYAVEEEANEYVAAQSNPNEYYVVVNYLIKDDRDDSLPKYLLNNLLPIELTE
jgi:hypothetical protein